MKTRSVPSGLPGALGLLLMLLCDNGLHARAERPNILYIFTDDQSRRTVGAYEDAHDWVRTPHLDTLASSGMRFTTCYTGASCQMSRAMMLTGRLQHAIRSLDTARYPACDYDPVVQPFWPAEFRRQGYQTACIGKWHLGEDVGHGRDWDYSAVWDRCGPKKNRNAYYYDTLLRFNGGERVPLNGYSTDRYTELAVDYIHDRARPQERPWFLWLCYGGVHGPYTEAERHQLQYAAAPPSFVPADIFGPRPTKPRHLQNYTRWTRDPRGGPRGFDSSVKKYHRAVASVDEGVGALIEALKSSGQLDNTLVVFTSDQGFAWGQHGCREKWMAYDANIAAPLIIAWPRQVRPLQVCQEPVSGIDLVRLFHRVAGVEPVVRLQGRDLSPLLTNPRQTLSEPLLLTHTARLYGDDFLRQIKAQNFVGQRTIPAWIMLRDGHLKYIRHLQTETIEELYDLKADPHELTNLAVSKKHADQLSALRQLAERETRRLDGAFVDLAPAPRTVHHGP